MDKRPHADRDTDAGFERLLRQTLRRDESVAGSECVEPDTLAAWSEGALPPSERSFVEAHAARCARCSAMLAAMARTAPVDAGREVWSIRRWMTMLAPAAAAAAAVVFWFAAEPRRPPLPQPVPPTSAVPEPASPSAAASPRDERAASSDRRDPPAAAPAGQSAGGAGSGAPTPQRAPESRSARFADASKDDERKASESEAERRQARDRLMTAAREEAPMAKVADASAKPAGSQPGPPLPVAKPVASPAPPPPQPAAVTAPSPAVQTQAGATQQSPSQADQQGPGSLRYGTAIGGARALERPGLNEIVAAPALVVASADRAVQWRVSNQRVIEHSADRGATWATQYALDPKATLTAGSSPTPLVAWLVGQGGLVMLTTDGRTWRRLAFPEAVDLVAVLAIDARTATVTASDRRSFTTADGGASWTVKP